MMKISNIAFEKMKEFEGCRLTAYQDAAGVWTIGYGHTGKILDVKSDDWRGVRCGDKISQTFADELLVQDIVAVERQVDALDLTLTQPQYDALVDFAFNVGIGNLERSTLLKFIRAGRSGNDIARQFKQWVYAGNPPRTLPGLVKRRDWEAFRYNSAF